MGLTIPKHTLSTLLFFTHTYPRPDSKMGVTIIRGILYRLDFKSESL